MRAKSLTRAAEALGGAERIQALRTMRLRGYGHDAYQDGGSLISTEPTAPEKMTIITAYERVIDLPNGRTRVRAKQSRAFVFAAQAMMEGRPIDQCSTATSRSTLRLAALRAVLRAKPRRSRRMELLAIRSSPYAQRSTRAPASRIGARKVPRRSSTLRRRRGRRSRWPSRPRPACRSGCAGWVRTTTSAISRIAPSSARYEPVNGVFVPMSFNTVSDRKDNVQLRLHVDRYVLDGDVGDLAAPAAVRSAPDAAPAYTVDASPVRPASGC